MAEAAAFIEQLFNGLTLGMVYVLLAAGLSVIFGVMDVINFSHGELFALGAYFALSIVQPFGAEAFWVALVVAPILVGVVGVLIERLTLRPLYDRDPLYHILLTFGLVLILKDLIALVWGTSQHELTTPAFLNQPLAVGGISISVYNLFMILVGAVLAVGTWLVLNRTRYGMIVRAGSQDREMVRNVGVDIDRYYTLIFGFGAALAAAAGVVLAANQNVNPGLGDQVIIPAFIIVVLGGLGSFRGAIYGGLLVGVLRTLTRSYLPFLEGLSIFVLMIAVLLLKPQGLFGDPQWHAEETDEGELLVGAGGGVLTATRRKRLGVAAVALLAVFPPVAAMTGNNFYVTLVTTMLIWGIFALSLDFVMGYAGLVSLGHAMFYGVGAYTAALAMLHVSSSIVVALVTAVVVCAIIAWVVGTLSIRVSGVYFAMITLAFAQLFHNLVFKLDWTGGSDGLLGFDAVLGLGGIGAAVDDIEFVLGPVTVTPSIAFYYLVLVLALACFLLARRFIRAPFGSVLKGISESEERVSFIGFDTTWYKRRAFVISGGIAGVAGTLFAASPDTFVIAPSALHWINSGEVLVMVLLGGMGTLFGPMVGAGVFIGAEEILSTYVEQWRLVIGTVFVLFVLFVPRGLVSVPTLLARRGDRSGEGGGGVGVAADESEVHTDD
jgi:branched-chain amino acid transport system permease protein